MIIDPQVGQRLTAVENTVSKLQQQLDDLRATPNWLEQIAGAFKEEPAFEEVLAYGRAIRSSDPQHVYLRGLCYMLLDKMPDEGLAETLTMLVDHVQFNSLPHETPPALPQMQQIPVTIGETRERPPLYIEEE